jgi:hypothetical protein
MQCRDTAPELIGRAKATVPHDISVGQVIRAGLPGCDLLKEVAPQLAGEN